MSAMPVHIIEQAHLLLQLAKIVQTGQLLNTKLKW